MISYWVRISFEMLQNTHVAISDTELVTEDMKIRIESKLYGSVTRDLFEFWKLWVGPNVDGLLKTKDVRSLFNAMKLFPSQSQVYEMIQCARDRDRNHGKCIGPHRKCSESCMRPVDDSEDYLTFGEFCVLATELRKYSGKELCRPRPVSRRNDRHEKWVERKLKNSCKYQIFLGGSCNPTTWREEIAIPFLKQNKITYYNPQVNRWGPELIELEHQAKTTATVLLFVMDKHTRSVASMIEAAHSSAKHKKLILVVTPFEKGQEILEERITDRELDDLRTSRMVLQDLAERRSIPVFDDLDKALRSAHQILERNINSMDLTLEDGAKPVRHGHIPLAEKLIQIRDVFESLDTNGTRKLTLNEAFMAFKTCENPDVQYDEFLEILSGKSLSDLSKDWNVISERREGLIQFDQLCVVLAEKSGSRMESKRNVELVLEKITSVFSPLGKVLEWMTGSNRPRGVSRSSSQISGEIPPCESKDVYLGGSCGSSTWREDIAIPLLKKNGLSYYAPQTAKWSRRFIPSESRHMDSCRILLFAITKETRSMAAMCMAAHYIALGCQVVLCVQYLEDDCEIMGEKLSKLAIQDYNRGRAYLSDLANRERIPVFDNVEEAVLKVTQVATKSKR
ncbi:uncharacterized protein LOC136037094 isoform X1 [Artemia franciscana]|uniref:EF-hand domain-containing protein n=1 Tax=Artemia franciscana TaxID=6661 RepID=A0AA88HX91_ARTSF|nr:hypothetical protein QYM36_005338 [Artemia franciscana]